MTITPPQRLQARLVDKQVLNDIFTIFRFEMVQPHRFTFDAGQYLSLKVHPNGTRRSYSLWSDPSNAHGFELFVEVIPNGVGSHFLSTLPFGSDVEFLAPLGQFTVPTTITPATPLVFIATGSGIAPFWSMLNDQLRARQHTAPIMLYWGLRHLEHLCWSDELQELQRAFPHFRFHPTLSQAPSTWPFCHGRVTECLRVHELPKAAEYFLCGNAQMILDVKAILQERGIIPTQIHTEKFTS